MRRVDVAADSLATLRTALREELEIEQQVTLYLRHADGKDERVRDLQQLKQASFGVADLRAAGFKQDDLRNVGFNNAQLIQGGFRTLS